jgi:phage shock protein A
MSIFSRLGDIINSNINAILDRAEDPAKFIRLIIQEMEDTLVEVRANAARTIAEKKEIFRKLERLRQAQAGWQDRAALALVKDREDLAKAALLEKTKLQETAQILEQELVHLEAAMAQGDTDISKLEAKLSEAKAKQKSLAARHETAGARLRVRRSLHDPRVDEALARFEQVEKKLDEAEGKVEAYDLGRPKTLAQEIADLAAESAIDEELAALKRRMARAGAARDESAAQDESKE